MKKQFLDFEKLPKLIFTILLQRLFNSNKNISKGLTLKIYEKSNKWFEHHYSCITVETLIKITVLLCFVFCFLVCLTFFFQINLLSCNWGKINVVNEIRIICLYIKIYVTNCHCYFLYRYNPPSGCERAWISTSFFFFFCFD